MVGHKIGLTSEPMQTLLGVDEPDFGYILDDGSDELRVARPVPGRLGWRAICATPRSHYVERLLGE